MDRQIRVFIAAPLAALGLLVAIGGSVSAITSASGTAGTSQSVEAGGIQKMPTSTYHKPVKNY